MAGTVVYLTTSLLQWRLVSPAHGSNKAAKLKAIMAAECAAELSNWLKGLRALIEIVICLWPTSIFCHNRAAVIIIGIFAAVYARQTKR